MVESFKKNSPEYSDLNNDVKNRVGMSPSTLTIGNTWGFSMRMKTAVRHFMYGWYWSWAFEMLHTYSPDSSPPSWLA